MRKTTRRPASQHGRYRQMSAGSCSADPWAGPLAGVSPSSGRAPAYPVGLGPAAGAMIPAVSHGVIPGTHRHGNQTVALLGLMVGFALMMVPDTAPG